MASLYDAYIAQAIETLSDIEKAVVAFTNKESGHVSDESMQRRIDNAVRVYCAQQIYRARGGV